MKQFETLFYNSISDLEINFEKQKVLSTSPDFTKMDREAY